MREMVYKNYPGGPTETAEMKVEITPVDDDNSVGRIRLVVENYPVARQDAFEWGPEAFSFEYDRFHDEVTFGPIHTAIENNWRNVLFPQEKVFWQGYVAEAAYRSIEAAIKMGWFDADADNITWEAHEDVRQGLGLGTEANEFHTPLQMMRLTGWVPDTSLAAAAYRKAMLSTPTVWGKHPLGARGVDYSPGLVAANSKPFNIFADGRKGMHEEAPEPVGVDLKRKRDEDDDDDDDSPFGYIVKAHMR